MSLLHTEDSLERLTDDEYAAVMALTNKGDYNSTGDTTALRDPLDSPNTSSGDLKERYNLKASTPLSA